LKTLGNFVLRIWGRPFCLLPPFTARWILRCREEDEDEEDDDGEQLLMVVVAVVATPCGEGRSELMR